VFAGIVSLVQKTGTTLSAWNFAGAAAAKIPRQTIAEIDASAARRA